MAILDKDGNLKGKVGDNTYRVVNGQRVVQSSPAAGRVKQTQGTKNCSTDFAVASNRARILRTVLYPAIKGFYDAKMINRLNAKMMQVLRSNMLAPVGKRDIPDADLALLNDFEFNVNEPFGRLFLPALVGKLEGSALKVSFSEFKTKENVRFPENATECTLTILLSAIDFEQNRYSHCGFKQLLIKTTSAVIPATDFIFDEGLPANSMLIATASLDFYADGLMQKISLNNKMLNPVKILAVYPPQHEEVIAGTFLSKEAGKKWFKISGITGKELMHR